jgi:hypothetical protein
MEPDPVGKFLLDPDLKRCMESRKFVVAELKIQTDLVGLK